MPPAVSTRLLFRSWMATHDERNKERFGVVYFALERADLVKRRLEAHKIRLNLPDLPIVVVKAAVNFGAAETVCRVIETIREIEAEYNCSAGLVIFDTFAKLIAAAGLDEDKARDQGLIFSWVQQVKTATDVHVALVEHTRKNVDHSARGSNAILGEVEVSGDPVRTATVTKANDAPRGTAVFLLVGFTSSVPMRTATALRSTL